MNAEEILAISSPNVLFKGDAQAAYRRLIKLWHPDRGAPRATEVSAHINALYASYLPSAKQVTLMYEGRKVNFHYLEKRTLATGDMYIGSESVLQGFHSSSLYKAAKAVIFAYKDEAMRKEHSRYLPEPVDAEIAGSGQYFVHYRKTSDHFSLAQIRRKYPVLPPEHVAWILSSLYNVNCCLGFMSLTYGGLTEETYFISPQQHNGMLIGGWASSAIVGFKPKVIFSELAGLGDTRTKAFDSACIRRLGRVMLGPELHKAPAPMRQWMLGVGRVDSVAEYKAWEDVLTASFGKRKFVPLHFTASDL